MGVILKGKVKGGVAIFISGVLLRAPGQQQFDCGQIAQLGGIMEGSCAILTFLVNVRPPVQQELELAQTISTESGIVEGSLASTIRSVNLHPPGQQELDHGHWTTPRQSGTVDDSLAINIFCVKPCPSVEQQFNCRQMALPSSQEEGSTIILQQRHRNKTKNWQSDTKSGSRAAKVLCSVALYWR
eukprot:GCRY01001033.1.p1 GENE.GCRY01001033.1~~GCRY01001033.1.p1  ORF type:complete len:185 (-),score=21.15 GCRY01001033.1:939-1493(-)